MGEPLKPKPKGERVVTQHIGPNRKKRRLAELQRQRRQGQALRRMLRELKA